ncbi:uncharacterized protein LOC132171518 [Corylus avellana]|uniref:uncharacterized protein LOC132171518 n=1 Tax=Corylus avellana TaxID=13451 RepID=UPI00286BEF1B|nr:uncharacterized protein LOC132171518 [Corylus avellana]XP_059438833.1 uncharacterized protein LOC132171518 [Corylus avellana]
MSHSQGASSRAGSLPSFPGTSGLHPTLMDDVETAMSSEEPNFFQPQQTSENANQSQVQLVELVVEEGKPSSSDSKDSGENTRMGERSQPLEERSQLPEQSPKFLEEMCNSLYRAALKNDWEGASIVFDNYGEGAAMLPISQERMNTLQVAIAVTAKYTTLVGKLLDYMNPKELEFKNSNGDTALSIAALSGNVKLAKEMVTKNNKLPMIRNNKGILPLLTAAMHKHRDMVLYLYSVTDFDQLTSAERIQLLLCTISWDMYDKAHEILKKDSTLATAEDQNKCTALEQLAKKPFAMSAWERFKGFWFESIYRKASMRMLAYTLVEFIWREVQKLQSEERKKYSSTIFLAAELGNVKFLTILIRSDPELIWMTDGKKRNIFHISIIYRQESIFNLIHEIGIFKDMIATCCDNDGNNMLHLAGKLAFANRLNIVSGAALQMQRELLWFKEVEKIVPLAFSSAKNLQKQMPNVLFKKTHGKLQRDGENWMRNTSTNCMLVSTLIATMVFGAAFTVPGGNNQVKGSPIFLERNWFTIFFVSDSIALLCSTSSVLIFLSILTSRYTEHDFLYSLPKRLVLGLTMLFISIVAMVVAFNATCFLVYQNKTAVIPSVTILLACIPILCFILLHCRLFFDIARSTLWSRYLFQSGRHKLF